VVSSAVLFAANLGATLLLTGVSWFAQVVHYPLFARVGAPGWPAYAAEHGRRAAWALGVPMVVELVTAGWLVAAPPAWLTRATAGGLAALVLIAWAATWRLERPLVARLAGRFDPRAHQALVVTHWVRVLAWWTRSTFLLWLAAAALTSAPPGAFAAVAAAR
jgi:hypothetical protein